MKAIAIFSNTGSHWAGRFLKVGFRHVAMAIQTEHGWVGLDPRQGTPDIQVICAPEFDLAAFYRGSGLAVAETEVRDIPFRWPFVIANCVGVVKAVLGIRAPLVWTPHQLYQHFTRDR